MACSRFVHQHNNTDVRERLRIVNLLQTKNPGNIPGLILRAGFMTSDLIYSIFANRVDYINHDNTSVRCRIINQEFKRVPVVSIR